MGRDRSEAGVMSVCFPWPVQRCVFPLNEGRRPHASPSERFLMRCSFSSPSQKSQTLAEEAWSKAQHTGHVKENLELQNVKFQEALDKSQEEKSALLSACALLSGALWPAYSRIRALTAQRNVLGEYLKVLESLRQQTHSLGEMLSTEMDTDAKAERSRAEGASLRDGRRPALVFRAAAIAVIAANRLCHFRAVSSRAFASSDCPGGTFRNVCRLLRWYFESKEGFQRYVGEREHAMWCLIFAER